MQVEDCLALESAKYNEIIKTRVKQLQEKIDEQRARIQTLQKDNEISKGEVRMQKRENTDMHNNLKNVQLDLKIANKDLKIKDEKLLEVKLEV